MFSRDLRRQSGGKGLLATSVSDKYFRLPGCSPVIFSWHALARQVLNYFCSPW